jgi:hypothetical protein
LNAVLSQTQTFSPPNVLPTEIVPHKNASLLPASGVVDLPFEIGFWFSGLESFLNVRNHSFVEESRQKAVSRDWTREFRLTHSTMLLCSKLIFELGKVLKNQNLNDKQFIIDLNEIFELTQTLKESILLSEAMLRAAPLKFGEWTTWSNLLAVKLKNLAAFEKFILIAEKNGENFLPENLRNLLESTSLPFAVKSDLALVLPRFAKILKWLSVVDRMLKNDEPLKPSLLAFSRIYEQIQEMISYVNNRLLRFPDEDDALFASLDGAAYAASIELRKVYNHELTGLSEIRSAPSVYAKIETAYSLLNDSFQQTLVGFAQVIDPNIEPTKMFPAFQIKLEQSLILRQSLWQMMKIVRQSEQNPETFPPAALQKQLTDFLDTALRFLFYKDMETVERFIEEVLVTTSKKDLVPILHRFGAYIETLFGQVNMRTVLAKYPFNQQ